MISRRGFLKGSAVLGGMAFGGLTAFQHLAHAQVHPDAPDRYYVFCYFNGGWDILLGLDPRDPQLFNNSNFRSTLIQPGYEQLQSGDGQIRRARLLSQPGMEMVHIVQAAGERANLGGIVVDAREQGVDA